jgi:hypothetical protein
MAVIARVRFTALSNFIVEDSLSEAECLNWLAMNSWREFGLPRLVEVEVEAVLRRHNASPLAQS